MSTTSVAASEGGVRERIPQPDQPAQASSAGDAQDTVKTLNEKEADKDDSEKKTYGRTPEGKGTHLRRAISKVIEG